MFGLAVLKQAFPLAKILALPGTVNAAKTGWPARQKFWFGTYGNNIPGKAGKTAAVPVTQAVVTNSDLDLKVYGILKDDATVNNEGGVPHVWTGLCPAGCAVTLRHKESFGDLTGKARIRWYTKTSGFHEIRPIVKLADGTWLVGRPRGCAHFRLPRKRVLFGRCPVDQAGYRKGADQRRSPREDGFEAKLTRSVLSISLQEVDMASEGSRRRVDRGVR
jgi:hypothetical protein